FAQQRLWIIDQLEPETPAYNIPSALHLHGRVDVESLRLAFEALIERHESLRTTFAEHDGQPVQVIQPPARWALAVTDLSHLPEFEREAEVRRRATNESSQPFSLASGPLLRTALLRLSEEHHVLFVTMHHIVSDGWSMGIIVRELTALYEAIRDGRKPSLPPLPMQYADFAAWQRGWLQGDVLQRQVDFWKRHLAGAPPLLELPTDKPRPAVQGNAGTTLSFSISKPLTDSLKALARQEGSSLFMVLLASWQSLLAHYSGQLDISVGSPIAGRTRAETEGLIGFFVNTLVLRAQLTPEMTFRELLAQVRNTTLAGYAHQDVPFEKLVEALQP
ncbi:non-ribosomal peptide synthetase, partial [Myxococcaceae bacterium JPH2]|nr:non-ribosomal peptide synthetase [Myxococcaceae bacterium JPH2]